MGHNDVLIKLYLNYLNYLDGKWSLNIVYELLIKAAVTISVMSFNVTATL